MAVIKTKTSAANTAKAAKEGGIQIINKQGNPLNNHNFV